MAQLFISCSSITIAVTLSGIILISAKNEFLIVDASQAMKALTVGFNYLNDHLSHSKPAQGEEIPRCPAKGGGKDLAIKLLEIY